MNPTTYISIDVATRSLAVGVYRMNSFLSVPAIEDMTTNPIEFNENLNSIIQPLLMKVFDINDGLNTKDTSIMTKAESLKKILEGVDKNIKDETLDENNVRVLIEYQMNANHGANAIFNMIMYHYAGRYTINVIKPALKNTIALHPLLTLSTFLATASTNYKANKDHTKYNMLYLLTMIDKMNLIADIKKGNLDDIADTLCQAIAFHIKGNI